MNQKHEEILKIKLDSTSVKRVLGFVRGKLVENKKFYIVTPNPEIVILAQKDENLAEALNSADLSLADGIGLVWAAEFLGLSGLKRVVRGREVFLELCKLANKKGWKVFLLGGKEGVAKKVARNLQSNLKKIVIDFATGPVLDKKAKPVTKNDSLIEKETLNHINKFKPHLLFVAFGAPKQEKWLKKWLTKLDIGGAMVVGGAFDYYSGRVKLPPKWMEENGLEWLWRLLHQPWRTRRIFTASVIFPIKIVGTRLKRI